MQPENETDSKKENPSGIEEAKEASLAQNPSAEGDPVEGSPAEEGPAEETGSTRMASVKTSADARQRSASAFMVWDGERMRSGRQSNFVLMPDGSLWKLVKTQKGPEGKNRFILEERPDCEVFFNTGLADKNGKAIYEGHVVEAIVYVNTELGLRKEVYKTGGGYSPFTFPRSFTTDECVVIGHIREDPGALTE